MIIEEKVDALHKDVKRINRDLNLLFWIGMPILIFTIHYILDRIN